MEPFYSLYGAKLETYYSSLIEKDPKKKANLMKQLHQLDKMCTKEEREYLIDSDRVIVVF